MKPDVVVALVPGDKSVGIRALLLALLATGPSQVRGLADSHITSTTITALRTLGAEVVVRTRPSRGVVAGAVDVTITPPRTLRAGTTIDCRGSATLARLLLGLLVGRNVEATVVGSEMLSRRPMARVAAPLAAFFGRPVVALTNGCLPAQIITGDVHRVGDDVIRPGDSAQVRSAVMFAAVAAGRALTLWSNRPGRRHTEQLLRWLNVDVVDDDALDGRPRRTSLSAVAAVPPIHLDVPGDPSAAAFLEGLAALRGAAELDIVGLLDDEERTGFRRALGRMRKAGGLRGIVVDKDAIADLVDEVPILAAVCAAASSPSTLRGLTELRVKESDRLARIVDLLTAFGVRATVNSDDDLHIVPGPWAAPTAPICTDHDHRLAMTALVMATHAGVAVTLDDDLCVDDSWAGFAGVDGQLAAVAEALGVPSSSRGASRVTSAFPDGR